MEPVRGEGSGRGHSDGMWALGRVDVAEMKLDRRAWGRPEGEGRRRGYGGLGLAPCLIAPTEGAHESNGEGTICPSACAADALDSSSRRLRVVTLGGGGVVLVAMVVLVEVVRAVQCGYGRGACLFVRLFQGVSGSPEPLALKQADGGHGGQPCSRCDADTCWHSPASALQHPERSPAGTGTSECVLAGVLACWRAGFCGEVALSFASSTVAPAPIPSYAIHPLPPSACCVSCAAIHPPSPPTIRYRSPLFICATRGATAHERERPADLSLATRRKRGLAAEWPRAAAGSLGTCSSPQ
jgi:hypothetical protein